MGFDELLGIVESFCNRASQVASVTVETGSTSAGIGCLILSDRIFMIPDFPILCKFYFSGVVLRFRAYTKREGVRSWQERQFSAETERKVRKFLCWKSYSKWKRNTSRWGRS